MLMWLQNIALLTIFRYCCENYKKTYSAIYYGNKTDDSAVILSTQLVLS